MNIPKKLKYFAVYSLIIFLITISACSKNQVNYTPKLSETKTDFQIIVPQENTTDGNVDNSQSKQKDEDNSKMGVNDPMKENSTDNEPVNQQSQKNSQDEKDSKIKEVYKFFDRVADGYVKPKETKFLKAEDNNVTSLITIADTFISSMYNVSYKESNNGEKSLKLYTMERQKTFTENKFIDKFNKQLQDNQIISHYIGQSENITPKIWFNQEMTLCRLLYTFDLKYSSASQAYLENNKVKLDNLYRSQIVIYAQFEDNAWKIYNVKQLFF
ncbi:hypothetical protein [Dehalobacter restrictus]|uniref:Lipoprotein n=1 Tax=Dehalobacter restrictus (strain DSM 9455 / PER-K23) TaxID=871738 RepID=A0ABM5PA84_DEHRP|nr:hypothetical protein [Dehalobacter restrictus]AHF11476.1 hypothetical protein DEHRE_13130 [Dehalobacter restrictus DSM 9455]